jgi:hypothetical protein
MAEMTIPKEHSSLLVPNVSEDSTDQIANMKLCVGQKLSLQTRINGVPVVPNVLSGALGLKLIS